MTFREGRAVRYRVIASLGEFDTIDAALLGLAKRVEHSKAHQKLWQDAYEGAICEFEEGRWYPVLDCPGSTEMRRVRWEDIVKNLIRTRKRASWEAANLKKLNDYLQKQQNPETDEKIDFSIAGTVIARKPRR